MELPLAQSPAAFRARLSAAGLGPEWKVTTTDNRATMVSFRGHSVRVHRAYVDAPDPVIHAIVRFVSAKRRDMRRAASRVILAHAPAKAPADVVPIRNRERTHRADEPFVQRLVAAHRAFNAQRFEGVLSGIEIRVSRRMRRKLGHYSPATHGLPSEIAIGRQHIAHDSWDDVLHTLLHEMVHQWQDESGFALAHDARFRRMARAVGADPRAVRREAVG
ncbi:hypothetical protein BH23GEM2_BH23GEM2_19390 [soil metagenome]